MNGIARLLDPARPNAPGWSSSGAAASRRRLRLPVITLPDEQFAARHRVLRGLLWVHLVAVAALATNLSPAGPHAGHQVLTWTFVALALACGATEPLLGSARARALATSVGLLMCAGALVHATGGQTDMHFDFFVVLALIGLYQDWLPFAAAVGLVGIHHAVIGTLLPHSVYSTPAAQAHPIRYALIHAGFVTAMCAAQIAYWAYTAAAQAALAQAHARADLLALVAEHTDNAVVITDADGIVLWVNAAYTRTTGYTPDEAIGRTRRSMLHLAATPAVPADPAASGGQPDTPLTGTVVAAPADQLGDLLRRAVAGEDIEVEVLSREGRPYWMDLQVRPIPSHHRMPTRGAPTLIGIERDVTERREAARTAHEASTRALVLAGELDADKRILDSVLSAIPHLVAWHDVDGTLLGSNSAYTARLTSVAGLPDRVDDSPATDVDELSRVVAALRDRVLRESRPERDHHVTAVDPGDPEGIVRQYLVTVLPLDPEHTPGFTRTASNPCDPAEPGPDRTPATCTPQSPGAVLSVVGVLTVVSDVTEIAALERQLAQAHRLEALGQLAAGIAHEINTPIQFVADNTRFVADSLNDVLALLPSPTRADSHTDGRGHRGGDGGGDAVSSRPGAGTPEDIDVAFLAEELPAALAESLDGLKRVADIVRAMKEFSHPGSGLAAVDLESAVSATVQISRNEWKHAADVDITVEPGLPPVTGYEGELKQALLNLVVNAAHAIRARQAAGQPARGRIAIAVRAALTDHQPGGTLPAPIRGSAGVRSDDGPSTMATPSGPWVEIAVTDDGTGMTETVRRRVFDPFFTTKPVGQGTGQGLTLVHNVVTKHAGTVTVDSTPGRGTTFTIRLPTVP